MESTRRRTCSPLLIGSSSTPYLAANPLTILRRQQGVSHAFPGPRATRPKKHQDQQIPEYRFGDGNIKLLATGVHPIDSICALCRTVRRHLGTTHHRIVPKTTNVVLLPGGRWDFVPCIPCILLGFVPAGCSGTPGTDWMCKTVLLCLLRNALLLLGHSTPCHLHLLLLLLLLLLFRAAVPAIFIDSNLSSDTDRDAPGPTRQMILIIRPRSMASRVQTQQVPNTFSV